MLASQVERLGDLGNAHVDEVALPVLGKDDVRVKIEAAAINPSDVANIEGRFSHTTLPRIVGRDFAGVVTEGPADLIGTKVYGTGGDLGFTRSGTHAQYVDIPRAAVARRPSNLTAEEAAAIGVPFVTAWSAAIELGELRDGEWVIVSGAAGAVGSAAAQIARTRNAKIVALLKDESERGLIDTAGLSVIAYSDKNNLAEVVRDATGGHGCALALNGVGAPIFASLFDALAKGGRMVVYSAAGGRETTLDLFSLYRRRLTLQGLDTATFDAIRCAEILDQLRPLFESGALHKPKITGRFPLSKAPEAYALVKRNPGQKVVLIPD
jgi:NADPH:quinone reductase-like Zn-dependent oxidoreductase